VPRLFVAAWPPDDVVARLLALPRPEAPGVRWMPSANLHVTLRFLGEADADLATAALDDVRFPIATARVGPNIRRLGGRSLAVPVVGLDALAAATIEATGHLGRPPDGRPFTGHITLARLRRGAEGTSIRVPIHEHFDVDEVVLVHSEITSDGATYHPIGRWPTTRASG
jgi:2'-5' RNA ligase